MFIRLFSALLLAAPIALTALVAGAQDKGTASSEAAAAPSLQIQADGLDSFAAGEVYAGRVAIAPGGTLLAVINGRNLVLFDGRTGRRLRRWSVSDNPFESRMGQICFADHGEHLLYKPYNGKSITLYRTRDGMPIRRYEKAENHSNCLNGTGFTARTAGPSDAALPNFEQVDFLSVKETKMDVRRTGQFDGTVFPVEGGQYFGVSRPANDSQKPDVTTVDIYSLKGGKWLRSVLKIDRYHGLPGKIAVSADAAHLAYIAGGETDTVMLRDLATQRSVDVAPLRNFKTDRVEFLNGGRWLLGATDRRDWIIVDRATMRIVRRGKDYRGSDATGKVIVVADSGGDGNDLLTIPSFERQARIAPLTAPIEYVAARNGSLYLGTQGLIKQISLSQTGADMDLASKVVRIAADPATGRLAFWTSDSELVIQSPAGARVTADIPGGEVPIYIDFLSRKDLVVVTVTDAVARRIEAESRERFSEELRRILAGAARLYVADDTGRVRKVIEGIAMPDALHGAADGETLWMATRQRVTAYRLPDFKQTRILDDAAGVTAIATAENGAVLITTHGSRRVVAWDVASRSRIGEYAGSSIHDVTVGVAGTVYIADERRIVAWRYRAVPQTLRPPQDARAISFRLDRYARQAEPGQSEVEVGAMGPAAATNMIIPVDACQLPLLFSRDARYLMCGPPNDDYQKQGYAVIDTTTGTVVRRFEHWGIRRALPGFTADGTRILLKELSGPVVTLDIVSGERQEILDLLNTRSVDQVAQSADARRIALRVGNGFSAIQVFERRGAVWTPLARIPKVSLTDSLAMSNDGTLIARGTRDGIFIHDAQSGAALRDLRTKVASSLSGGRVSFSSDGKRIIALDNDGATLLDAQTGELVQPYKGRVAVSGDRILQPGAGGLTVHDMTEGGSAAARWETIAVADEDLVQVLDLPQGFILGARQDGLLGLWDKGNPKPVAHLAMTPRGRLVVIDREGRFDAGSLEELDLLHWVRAEEPFRPLPLELFMRDYYEPKLLWRLLNREKLPVVRSLDTLNLVQPAVSIHQIVPEQGAPGRVRITVEVARAESEFQREGRKVRMTTGVHDLRLFRDGQLVGNLPEAGGEIKVDPGTGKALLTFSNVQLPLSGGRTAVEFSAYAFNDDRIKSATAQRRYELPADLARSPVKGRAYVVTIGVNAHENKAFDLAFAVNDSRRFEEVVAARLKARGEYAEVIAIPLRTEKIEASARGQATKENLKNVLALLSGRSVDAQAKALIPGAEAIREATPDDVVLISFSGHGYAGEAGLFYLLVSDTGAGSGQTVTEALLKRAISSNELTEWLRHVDAGELTLIIDACHSAASVEGLGFKPGPMGSRSLGQLAYDKGMRILAASQADDVALESELIKQGLLSYALVNEGLEAGRADFKPQDRKVTIEEWLAYGVARVPGLTHEIHSGAVRSADGKPARVLVVRPGSGRPAGAMQQPVLFDFASRRAGMILQ